MHINSSVNYLASPDPRKAESLGCGPPLFSFPPLHSCFISSFWFCIQFKVDTTTLSRMQLEGTGADTTTLSYWLNWRVLLCAIWVFVPMVIALLMIWKCDGKGHSKSDRRDTQQDISQDFCGDEAWRPCLKEIHPVWLLIYRVISFSLLLATLIIKVAIAGSRIFYFYTQ